MELRQEATEYEIQVEDEEVEDQQGFESNRSDSNQSVNVENSENY